MRNFLRTNRYLISLIFICLIVVTANYQPGTILSGWDTLHPEFNFPEYFRRVFFGVWQEHQGLGALATQSHASEIPRLIFYYLFSFITPVTLLRYIGIFITLFLGPVGVFLFLKKIFEENDYKDIISFCGGSFYLLNLVVVQQFYVPFEMFAIHYASIGWIFLFSVKYIEKNSYKNLSIFAFASFISSAMAHTATLWYVYFFGISLFIFSFFLLKRQGFIFKRGLMLICIIILTNLFWILPNFYFVANMAKDVQNSKIHSLFSEEAFAQNASYGTLPDLLLFKNFLFNWGEYGYNERFVSLLDEWTTHLQNPFALATGYFLSFSAILGIFYSIKKKNIIAISILPIFIVGVFFWLNINPPFGFLFSFFQEKLEFFKEAFRFPFTKFSILLIFATSLYFSFAVSLIISLLKKSKATRFFIAAIPFLVFGILMFYTFPAFKGYLISPSMKVNVPKEYFDLFNWFQSQPRSRISILPINSFWGWTYYNWNYQGAGFLWFGIPQPLLDREFDRWSPYNEQYYREMSEAVYSKDASTFDLLLEKYNIGFVLFDENIIAPGPGNDPRELYYDEIKNILNEQKRLKLVWHKGSIFVYKIIKQPSLSYILKNPPSVGPPSRALYTDFAYIEKGEYISNTNPNFYYPLRALMDNQNRLSLGENQQGLILNLGNDSGMYNFPLFAKFENNIGADLFVEKSNSNLTINMNINLPDGTKTQVKKISSSLPNNNAVISINGRNNFIIDEKISEDTPFFLGKALIHLSKPNTLNIYPYETETKKNFDPLSTSYDFVKCGENDTKATFGVNQGKNGFTIFGENSQMCLMIPLSKVIDVIDVKDKFLLTLNYKFKGAIHSNLCLLSAKEGKCRSSSIDLNINNSQNSQVIEANINEVKDLFIRIFLDSTQGSKKIVSFEDFSLEVAIPMSQNLIDGKVLSPDFKEKKIQVSNITFPFSGDESLSKSVTTLPKTGGPCSQVGYKESLPLKKTVVKKENEDYIRYYSEEGSLCDHFSYGNLPHNQGYIIAIVSRNVKGLPLRLCVANYFSKRCDLYTHLTDSKIFKKEYFFIPPVDTEIGYDVNLNNFAVKNNSSINDLKSIEVIPFPSNWASRIHSSDENNKRGQRINVTTVKEYNPSLYSIDAVLDKNDVVVLPQAFEKGWKLYKVGSVDNLSLSLPFVFGKNVSEHVKVNNWANGWLFNEKYTGQIILIYWPQYLEYLGLAFSFGTLFLLTFVSIKKHAKN